MYKKFILTLILSSFTTLYAQTDTDQDSIVDAIDLDDDNDGILDIEENFTTVTNKTWKRISRQNAIYQYDNEIEVEAYCNMSAANLAVYNYTFPNLPGIWQDDNLIGKRNLFTYANNGSTYVFVFKKNGVPVQVENPILHLEGIGERVSGKQASAVLFLQGDYTWSKLTGTSDFLVTSKKIDDAGNGLPAGNNPYPGYTTLGTNDGPEGGSVQILGEMSSLVIDITWDRGEVATDAIKFAFTLPSVQDIDKDGVINSLDLDSDNDGIYDGIEAGHGVELNNLGRIKNSEIITNIGANGFFNALEDGTETGNYISSFNGPINTDGRIYPDYLDLDSDNDNCYDTNEAYNLDYQEYLNNPTDFNADGTYGGLITSLEVDDNGLVNSANYSAPTNLQLANVIEEYKVVCGKDSDGDLVIDRIDLDDDNDGVLDTTELYCEQALLVHPTNYTYNSTDELYKSLSQDYKDYNIPSGDIMYKTIISTVGTTFIIKLPRRIKNPIFGFLNIDFYEQSFFDGDGKPLNLTAIAVSNDTQIEGNTLRDTDPTTTGANSANGYVKILGDVDVIIMSSTKRIGSQSDGFRWQVLEEICTGDKDQDGIINSLDLDADGDGCPDAVEAGVTGELLIGNIINKDPDTNQNFSSTEENVLAKGPYGLNGLSNFLGEIGNEDDFNATTSYTNTYLEKALNQQINACKSFGCIMLNPMNIRSSLKPY